MYPIGAPQTVQSWHRHDSVEFDLGATGATATLNPANGLYQKATVTAACTVSLATPPAGYGARIVFRWVVSGGTYALTWPATGFRWMYGATPTFGTAAGNENIAVLLYGSTGWVGDGGACQ